MISKVLNNTFYCLLRATSYRQEMYAIIIAVLNNTFTQE